MIPLKLTLEGLYSYQSRQTLDFTRLTDAGLFGIFGAVGSGKSSILEAISFALYGRTERLNLSGDNRNYNMLNLKSDRAYIDLEFLNFQNKKYRAVREFRRNSKRFDDVKPSAALYEWKDEDWHPLTIVNADSVLGNLSYENFKRTIIIPQGQFREFIELGPTARTQMMKEIFPQLQQYDLASKTKLLREANTAELNHLEGRLKGFEDVSAESVNELTEQCAATESNYKKRKKQHTERLASVQELRARKADFDVLNQKSRELSKLESRREEMQRLQKSVDEADFIARNFAGPFRDLNRVENELKKQKEDERFLTDEGEKLTRSLTEAQTELQDLTPKFEILKNKRAEEEDLKNILSILKAENEIERLQKRVKAGNDELEKVATAEQELLKQITDVEAKITSLKSKLIDPAVMMAVSDWFSRNEHLNQDLKKHKQRLEAINKELTTINTEAVDNHIELDSFEETWNRRSKTLAELRTEWEKKRDDLRIKQQLSAYAHQLHDGEACPLCGSAEHPNIAEAADVSEELQECEKKLAQNEADRENHYKFRSVAQNLKIKKQNAENQKQAEQEALTACENQLREHLQKFQWPMFSPKNREGFEAERMRSAEQSKQLDHYAQNVEKLRKEREEQRLKNERFKKAVDGFRMDEHAKQSQVATLKNALKKLAYNDFASAEVDGISVALTDLINANDKVESDFHQLQKHVAELVRQQSVSATKRSAVTKRLAELNNESLAISENINALLNESQLSSARVQQVLENMPDIAAERKCVEDFNIHYQSLKKGIEDLTDKLKDKPYDSVKHAELEQQCTDTETELEKLRTELGGLQKESERLTKALNEKKSLLESYDKLRLRAENLKTLTQLFHGSGFAEYVSTLYLRTLCEHANQRFHRMTRNRLSLQLNSSNDFEIIDYLNGGKSRSIKTLSGGQAFQVSLSLALALAESVQSGAAADRNFFFIDEGFGTQDGDSIHVVFETLNNLLKENRIVGIISHVEELKEKIPISLHIYNDAELGSRISMEH
ncbi:MAG: SMC family ATPase [Chryseobacterium sp.]|nr:MAG: SMC family ATPase [Chryseobacterium sp.]